MMNRTIGQIAAILGIDCKEHQDVAISGVTIDSRKVKQGNLFVPFKGENADGHKYVEQAIAQGAAGSLWQKDVPNPPVGAPLLFVEDNLKALQTLAKAYLQSTNAKVVGITGTTEKRLPRTWPLLSFRKNTRSTRRKGTIITTWGFFSQSWRWMKIRKWPYWKWV